MPQRRIRRHQREPARCRRPTGIRSWSRRDTLRRQRLTTHAQPPRTDPGRQRRPAEHHDAATTRHAQPSHGNTAAAEPAATDTNPTRSSAVVTHSRGVTTRPCSPNRPASGPAHRQPPQRPQPARYPKRESRRDSTKLPSPTALRTDTPTLAPESDPQVPQAGAGHQRIHDAARRSELDLTITSVASWSKLPTTDITGRPTVWCTTAPVRPCTSPRGTPQPRDTRTVRHHPTCTRPSARRPRRHHGCRHLPRRHVHTQHQRPRQGFRLLVGQRHPAIEVDRPSPSSCQPRCSRPNSTGSNARCSSRNPIEISLPSNGFAACRNSGRSREHPRHPSHACTHRPGTPAPPTHPQPTNPIRQPRIRASAAAATTAGTCSCATPPTTGTAPEHHRAATASPTPRHGPTVSASNINACRTRSPLAGVPRTPTERHRNSHREPLTNSIASAPFS